MDAGSWVAGSVVAAAIFVVAFALFMERRERKRGKIRDDMLEAKIADGIRRGRIQAWPRGERR